MTAGPPPAARREAPTHTPAEEPVANAVSGPAFPPLVKALASLLVTALVVSATMALSGEPGIHRMQFRDWAFLAAAALVVGSGWWSVQTSQTRIDGVVIEQTWMWRKRVEIVEIREVKLIDVPGLGWLIVPRLMVRSGFGVTIFHAGDPAVLARFRLLAHGA